MAKTISCKKTKFEIVDDQLKYPIEINFGNLCNGYILHGQNTGLHERNNVFCLLIDTIIKSLLLKASSNVEKCS